MAEIKGLINAKGKGGGGVSGGIPVITLQASQMVDQTHIQFTEEQYNTIVNNGAFYLDILGSQQLLMTCVNASNLANVECYNISQTGSGLQLATIELNKSTYIGVLGISPYPQAKQLYQHNVCLTYDNAGFERTWIDPIINDNPNPMFSSYNDFKDWLKTNYNVSGAITGGSKVLRASGYAPRLTSNDMQYLRCVYAIYNKHDSFGNDLVYAIGIKDGTNAPSELGIMLHGGTIAVVEDVIPL